MWGAEGRGGWTPPPAVNPRGDFLFNPRGEPKGVADPRNVAAGLPMVRPCITLGQKKIQKIDRAG